MLATLGVAVAGSVMPCLPRSCRLVKRRHLMPCHAAPCHAPRRCDRRIMPCPAVGTHRLALQPCVMPFLAMPCDVPCLCCTMLLRLLLAAVVACPACHATHAAIRMPPHLQAVAREYAWWVNDSQPFDVGATTATAFSLPYGQKSDYAATIQVNG